MSYNLKGSSERWEVLIMLLTYIFNGVEQLQRGKGSGGGWEGQW
jgi:hypothetical protein